MIDLRVVLYVLYDMLDNCLQSDLLEYIYIYIDLLAVIDVLHFISHLVLQDTSLDSGQNPIIAT